MTAFVYTFRRNHLRGNRTDIPGLVQEETGPREIYSRRSGSHTFVGNDTNLERTGSMWDAFQEEVI